MDSLPVALTVKYPTERVADDGNNVVICIKEFDRMNFASPPKTWIIGTFDPKLSNYIRMLVGDLRDSMFPDPDVEGTRPLTEDDINAIKQVVNLTVRRNRKAS